MVLMKTKKKVVIALLFIISILSIACVLFISNYKVNRLFSYEIDTEKKEVIITKYNGADWAKKQYQEGKTDEIIYLEKVEIPSKIKGYPVTTIDDWAFEWAETKEIVLPESITIIGDNTFAHCDKLETIKGMDNVEVVGNFAFLLCSSLKEINMPKLKQVGELAFAGCDSVEEIEISGGVTTISFSVCDSMDNLKKVVIRNGVKNIEASAFASCKSLEEGYIPSSVSDINLSSFRDVEKQIIIFGEKDSYAEEYADANGITFQEDVR